MRGREGEGEEEESDASSAAAMSVTIAITRGELPVWLLFSVVVSPFGGSRKWVGFSDLGLDLGY
jgi:hypothetical protein